MSTLEESPIDLQAAPMAALPAPSPVRGAMRQVPFRVAAMMRLSGLKLRDLRSLKAGHLLMTETSAADDVPVLVGGIVLGHAELDNVDGQMAVRLTRLN